MSHFMHTQIHSNTGVDLPNEASKGKLGVQEVGDAGFLKRVLVGGVAHDLGEVVLDDTLKLQHAHTHTHVNSRACMRNFTYM